MWQIASYTPVFSCTIAKVSYHDISHGENGRVESGGDYFHQHITVSNDADRSASLTLLLYHNHVTNVVFAHEPGSLDDGGFPCYTNDFALADFTNSHDSSPSLGGVLKLLISV